MDKILMVLISIAIVTLAITYAPEGVHQVFNDMINNLL